MKNLGQVTENQDIARKQDIPTNTNQLTNGAGFITNSALSGYVPTSRTVNGKALSGNISLTASDVGALPSSTTIPTALSQLSADATHRTVTDTEKATWNSKSSFSGSYTDLTNKPTIPTVNNGTLTIQKNGTNVATFTANQSTNATANIIVPTKTSDLNNDSGFITSADLPSGGVTSVAGYTGSVTTSQLKQGLQDIGGGFHIGTGSSLIDLGQGGAIGNSSTASDGGAIGLEASATTGGAIGWGASATIGFAGGTIATTTTGGAAGSGASSTTGFAGGYNAKATADGAVQLGEGTNATANTLQFRGYQLLNASGKIPAERLNISGVTSVIGHTGAVTAAQIKTGIQTSDGGFAIGTEASAGSGCACGAYANATEDAVAIGNSAAAEMTSVAIGYEAVAADEGAVQLGTGTNSNAETLQFRSYPLLNASGKIPAERLDYTFSKNTTGYLQLSNGFIIQWKKVPYSSYANPTWISFPKAFPNSCLGVVISVLATNTTGNDSGSQNAKIAEWNNTNVKITSWDVRGITIIAVGY